MEREVGYKFLFLVKEEMVIFSGNGILCYVDYNLVEDIFKIIFG